MPLVAGCAGLVVLMLGAFELGLWVLGIRVDEPQRFIFLARGTLTSAVLAAWVGWYVVRSRSRIEAAREELRAEQAALQEKLLRAEQAAGVGALSRVLAHEIRNPLHNMVLSCALLRKMVGRLGESGGSRALEVATTLENEALRLDKLLEEYLGHGPSSSAPLDAEPIALAHVVSQTMEALRSAAEARGITVELKCDGGDVTVPADPGKLRQLLQNLLRNALEAQGSGGRVKILVGRDSSFATLSVVDDGPGFTDPQAAFRPFYTTKPTGTGLGLAVVRDIVRAHRGQVTACNVDSKGGARIDVRLPLG